MAAADYAVLRVSDISAGMTPVTQQRMFAPFVTTKSHGHGLGLEAVRGIAQAHDGTISMSSKVGEGTTFSVLLP